MTHPADGLPEAVPAARGTESRARVEEFRRRHRTGLVSLLFTDLVGSTALKQDLGDAEGVALMQAQAALVRETLRPFAEAKEISTSGDSFFCAFVKPSDAIAFALRLQALFREEFGPDGLALRVGVHLGEVVIEERPGEAKPRDLFGLQVDTAARVMSLAEGGRILCTRSVFDNARQVLKGRDVGARRGSEAGEADPGPRPLVWLNHGRYVLKGVEDPIEICEVAEEGLAPLPPPGPSEKAHPAGMSEEELGWRPAPEIKVPGTAWVLVAKLGEGGFGEVWRARHPQTKETRVFKFCFLKERLRGLRRELAIFRILREKVGEHPNIVRLHEVFLDAAPYYLSMEDVPGRNLREWLTGEREWEGREDGVRNLATLSTRVKLDIAAQVADALAAATRAGVIHQDVKPENILVDESAPRLPSGAPRVKLADFGVGRVVNEEILGKISLTGIGRSIVLTTGSGSQSGTLLYMAPERLEGKRASPRSDLYSLGVVLFQMLAGDLDRAVTLDWDVEVTDPTLRDDLRRVLAGSAERRMESAEAFAERLRTWEGRRLWRRVRRSALAAAAVLLTFLGTTAYFLTRQSALQGEAEEAARTAARERSLRAEAEGEKARAESSERRAREDGRRFHAEAEYLKAERDENAGNRMSALAHAIASTRLDPRGEGAGRAWQLRTETRSLLWTSPNMGHHDGDVTSVAFSPDGTRIVSGARDNTVRLWDAATGKETARPGGHTSEVTSVAFSQDGTRVASRDENGVVFVWDATTGSLVMDLPPAEAQSLLRSWQEMGGPREPTRRPTLGAVVLAGEPEWRTAWYDPAKDENGLPGRVAKFLDRWEREIGMRVNLETGQIERLPTPGPAYEDDPEIAPRCK